MQRCAIFDMDGTLADVSSIRHHLRGPGDARDFFRFHSESVNVPANDWVVRAAKECKANGLAILIVTARGHQFRNLTAFWLAMHDVPSDMLFMRHQKDGRQDRLVKADILARIRQLGFVPVIAFDDNPNVIGLWEDNHIPTIVVPGYTE